MTDIAAPEQAALFVDEGFVSARRSEISIRKIRASLTAISRPKRPWSKIFTIMPT